LSANFFDQANGGCRVIAIAIGHHQQSDQGKSKTMGELKGKVGIVTGGSGGIGYGIARKLVHEGAQLVIADIDEERGLASAKELGNGTMFRKVDVADQQQIRDVVDYTVDSFGALNIMVNNAGIGGKRNPRLFDEDFGDFHLVLGIDLLGVMAGTREAARAMAKAGKGGSIVNISSVGAMTAGPGNWAYTVAKAGVIHFTKASAIDLGEYQIRVNAISPGNIETGILEENMAKGVPPARVADYMQKVRSFIQARQPLKMQGHVDDIAEAALFFLSERSKYITGTTIPVDGGLVAGSPPSSSSALQDLKREAIAAG
jgi:NAD(P)-dependent dehydrogenase (short-subunit alcohol dehydrogenase family)